MAASTCARLQRKAARTFVSGASAHSSRRGYGIQFTTPGAVGSAVPLIKETILHPAALFFPAALDVVGVRGPLLAGHSLAPGLEFHIAQALQQMPGPNI
jgi:hypothetical protein